MDTTMLSVLHIDASARRQRSHTRRLSALFIRRWLALRPQDEIVRRDVGLDPPPPIDEAWIAAAFTPPGLRTPEMQAKLALSERLVDEIERADLIVAGVPMYNFGMPAAMKAYVDQIVRVGRTFGFDRARPGEPYWPMLHGKRLVILSARGDYDYASGGRLAAMNHVEPHLATAFAYIGITRVDGTAVEYDEFNDARLQESMARAEQDTEALAARLAGEMEKPLTRVA